MKDGQTQNKRLSDKSDSYDSPPSEQSLTGVIFIIGDLSDDLFRFARLSGRAAPPPDGTVRSDNPSCRLDRKSVV